MMDELIDELPPQVRQTDGTQIHIIMANHILTPPYHRHNNNSNTQDQYELSS
jgi:hypothetical protein